MELEITEEVIVGSPLTFNKRDKPWIIRDLFVWRQCNDKFRRNQLVCLIAAKQDAPETENQVRFVLFSKDDLSGMIDEKNNIFLYLNKKKDVIMHLRLVDESFHRTA